MTYRRPAFFFLTCLLFLAQPGSAQESPVAGIASSIRQLKSTDPTIHAAATEAVRRAVEGVKPEDLYEIFYLSMAGSDESPALVRFLDDPDPAMQLTATLVLSANSAEVEKLIPVMVRQLKQNCIREDLGGAANCAMVEVSFTLAGLGFLNGNANIQSALVSLFVDKKQDSRVRATAAEILRNIGQSSQAAIPALLDTLQDKQESASIRGSAGAVLGHTGAPANVAMPALMNGLRDENPEVRVGAIRGVAGIGAEARDAVPLLITALKDDDANVRRAAAEALGHMDIAGNTTILLVLGGALKDKDKEVQRAAGKSMATLSQQSPEWVFALTRALDYDNPQVREMAAYALGFVGSEPKLVIPALIRMLSDQDPQVRKAAAVSLGNRGADSRSAVPDLVVALDFSTDAAAESLAQIAHALQQEGTHTETIGELNRAKIALTDRGPSWQKQAKEVEMSVTYLEAVRERERWRRLIRLVWENPIVSAAIAVYVALALVSLLLFWLSPLSILNTNDILRPYMDIPIPIGIANIKIPLRHLLLLGLFHYHPRVLDAWISKHITTVRAEFRRMSTVKDREVHVETPVLVDKKPVLGLTAKQLQAAFAYRRSCVLVWGEGGSGKTSLACQIASWAMDPLQSNRLKKYLMIPILIENDLDLTANLSRPLFLEAVQGRLRVLTDQAESPSEDLVTALLRRQRLLVIVDGLSELKESTRQQLRSSDPRFPANALVVTSRVQEQLEGLPRTSIQPSRIRGNRLSSFMEAYLIHRSSREFFEDPEFFLACSKLSSLVGQHDCTVLLAKLYAEQMISLKERLVTLDLLPETLPDLMLEYLNEVNSTVVQDRRDDREVHAIAKIMSWECLRTAYRSSPAQLSTVQLALGTGEDAVDKVKYFESRLRLVETIGAGRDSLRFTLDPVAEYFAALYFVDRYPNDRQAWEDFLSKADSISASKEAIGGFLRAVQDCWNARHAQEPISSFVAAELGRRVKSLGDPIPEHH